MDKSIRRVPAQGVLQRLNVIKYENYEDPSKDCLIHRVV